MSFLIRLIFKNVLTFFFSVCLHLARPPLPLPSLLPYCHAAVNQFITFSAQCIYRACLCILALAVMLIYSTAQHINPSIHFVKLLYVKPVEIPHSHVGNMQALHRKALSTTSHGLKTP